MTLPPEDQARFDDFISRIRSGAVKNRAAFEREIWEWDGDPRRRGETNDAWHAAQKLREERSTA